MKYMSKSIMVSVERRNLLLRAGMTASTLTGFLAIRGAQTLMKFLTLSTGHFQMQMGTSVRWLIFLWLVGEATPPLARADYRHGRGEIAFGFPVRSFKSL